MSIKSFKELNVQTPAVGWEGTKITLDQLFGREIIVHDFDIKKSKFPKDGKDSCLHMQVAIGDIKYVCFTPAITLIKQIEQIAKSDLPIKTTIVKEGVRPKFS